jgi:LmbE family N-acetylglucosaminyl deacetylase
MTTTSLPHGISLQGSPVSKVILIVAAHTDDEALGCGGTIARHVAEGDTVHAVFIADGVSSRAGADPADLQRRQAAAAQAHAVLGIQKVVYLGLPDNRLDSLPLLDVVQPLEAIIRELSPEVIYTHHYGDLNVDHRITNTAVMTACRPVPGHKVREIYQFEVMSSTEWAAPGQAPFTPSLYVDISRYLQKKINALLAYRLEMHSSPHSRSLQNIEFLARHRGMTVGYEAAEAFIVTRLLR